MSLLDFLLQLLVFILGSTASAVVMGLLINRFVIKKIMENKDIQDIVKLIRETKDALIEHNGKEKTLPEASDHKG